jgi:hypothetical protein
MAGHGSEVGGLKGADTLTMADQMRAAGKPTNLTTSPIDGSVTNPRREFLKKAIQYRANKATKSEQWDALQDKET